MTVLRVLRVLRVAGSMGFLNFLPSGSMRVFKLFVFREVFVWLTVIGVPKLNPSQVELTMSWRLKESQFLRHPPILYVCIYIYIYIYVPYIHLITHTSYTATLYFCTKADFHSFKDSLRPQIVRSYGIANKICPGSFSKSMPRQFQNDRIQRFIKMEQGALAQKGHRAVGFLTGTFSTWL